MLDGYSLFPGGKLFGILDSPYDKLAFFFLIFFFFFFFQVRTAGEQLQTTIYLGQDIA